MGLTVRSYILGSYTEISRVTKRRTGNVRLFHKKDNEENDNQGIQTPDAIRPSPGRSCDKKAKCEWRQERRDDEAHGPYAKLEKD